MHTWTVEESAVLKETWLAYGTRAACASALFNRCNVTRSIIAIYHKLAALHLLGPGRRDRRIRNVIATAGLRANRDVKVNPGVACLAILELKADQCKYPHGDFNDAGFHYCGGVVHKRSYCAEHFALCYTNGQRSGEAA